MCIRAFEYLPPVDITFGDYLRALVTADYDLVADAGIGQREAMIEAFRRRGIYPAGVVSLAEDSLRWPRGAAARSACPARRSPSASSPSAATFASRGARRRDASATSGTAVYSDLRAWASANMRGARPRPGREDRGPRLPLDLPRPPAAGELVVEIVAQFTQKHDTTGDETYGGLPVRGGATVVASAEGDVRFVIAKPLDDATSAASASATTSPHRDLADPRAALRRATTYLKQRAQAATSAPCTVGSSHDRGRAPST